MSRPQKLPRWADNPTDPIPSIAVIEPTEAKKSQGWDTAKPPFAYWNWLLNTIYNWFDYFLASGRRNEIPSMAAVFGVSPSAMRGKTITVDSPSAAYLTCGAFDGRYLWVDATTAGAYMVKVLDTLGIDSVITITTDCQINAMAFDGSAMWFAGNGYFYKYGTWRHATPYTKLVSSGGDAGHTTYNYKGICVDPAHDHVYMTTASGSGGNPGVHVILLNEVVPISWKTTAADPRGIVTDAVNVFVACYNGGSGTKVDVFTVGLGSVTEITVGNGPVCLDYDGSIVWVGNAGDHTIQPIDVLALTAGSPISLGSSNNPSTIRFIGNGLFVACNSANKIFRCNPNDGAIVETMAVTGPNDLIYTGPDVWTCVPTTGKTQRFIA